MFPGWKRVMFLTQNLIILPYSRSKYETNDYFILFIIKAYILYKKIKTFNMVKETNPFQFLHCFYIFGYAVTLLTL